MLFTWLKRRSISSATIWRNAVSRPWPRSVLPWNTVTVLSGWTAIQVSSFLGSASGHGPVSLTAAAAFVTVGRPNERSSIPPPVAFRKWVRENVRLVACESLMIVTLLT
jgi:hypothetical protein